MYLHDIEGSWFLVSTAVLALGGLLNWRHERLSTTEPSYREFCMALARLTCRISITKMFLKFSHLLLCWLSTNHVFSSSSYSSSALIGTKPWENIGLDLR